MVNRADRMRSIKAGRSPHLINTLLATAALLIGFYPAASLCAAAPPVVRYEDFGAKGDGKTDDHPAIIRAHEYANEHGLPVRAKDGATYYIGGKSNSTAVIQTDTDFGSAKFIIDDTAVDERGKNIFEVRSTLKPIKIEKVSQLKQNQERIDIKLPQPCLVVVQNENVRHYIRRGANRHSGVPQRDLFLVDANGNVDPNTAIAWDFDAITEFTAYPIPKAPLKITGGHFTTIANRGPSKYNYYGRGFSIKRSNTLVDGLEHYVTGEGKQGAPYGGFLNIGHCANVTVRNGVFTAHKTYRVRLGNFKKKMGTYDMSMGRALNVLLVNCRQSNDINDGAYWGIMVSNGSKNLTFDKCSFNRFDAHQGIASATIRNSTIGHAGIRIMGTGTLLVENTTIRSGSFVNLRDDYGSSWRGDLMIRNCVFQPPETKKGLALLTGKNNGQHNHGYPGHMPETITIEKLRIEDANPPADYDGSAVLGNFNPGYKDASYVEKVPYIKTREVILKDVTTASGKPLRLSNNPIMFRDVVVRGLDGN
ncbi:MAG: hypothetical protein ACI97B_001523 [Verrucomicrobiales bacterium]|jgi:hypothetical protein